MNSFAAGIRFIAVIWLGTTVLAAPPLEAQQISAAPALSPTALHLRVGDNPLDPATSLHASGVSGPGSAIAAAGHYVIQLDGPLTPQRQVALAQAGVHLGSYLPSHAYIIRLPVGFDPTTALAGLPFVRWLGAFDPAWKIDPEIGRRVWRTTERQTLAQQQRVRLAISLFPGENPDAVAAQLLAKPDVNVTDVQQNGEYGMIELEMLQSDVAALADIAAVQWVEEASDATLRNDTNAWILQSNVSNSTPVWDHGLTGVGQIGGLIDTGINSYHCAFRDLSGTPIGPTHRKIIFYAGGTTYGQHGTHTAGTFVGDPVPGGGDATYRGLAYGAKVAFTNIGSVTSTNLLSILTQNADAGARVHSNSWGDDTTTSYTTWSQAIDQFSFNNEDNLVVFAVTNASAAVKTPENAKNCLAVAATQDAPNQGSFCSGGTWYTQDGRRKPEVMAPGCSTISASGSGISCNTAQLTGTSMACPAAAGAALLAREYFTDGVYPTGSAIPGDAFTPSGALVKAVLISSAVDCTGILGYPSPQEGYGRVLLENSLYFTGSARKLMVQDVRNADGMTTGQSRVYGFTVNSDLQPLRVTLVWTEKEASVNANPAYINDLDLVVSAADGATYLGNVFADGQSVTGGTTDTADNVELVLRTTPAVGICRLSVNAAAVNTTTPQGFALVITGDVSAVLPPSITQQPQSQTAPLGGDAVFTVIASGTAPLIYQWRKDGIDMIDDGRVMGATTDTELIHPTVLGDAGSYDVVITNPAGSVTSQVVTLAIRNCGDMNCDGVVNNQDIDPFVLALFNPAGYAAQYPNCDILNGDFTGDAFVNNQDIDGFVAALFGS